MSEFKYLSVVDDAAKPVEKKPKYKVLNFNADEHSRSLIEPLHGTTLESAAQAYLFEHTREFMVLVRKYLPETNYETFEDIPMSRNPAIQKQLRADLELVQND